MTSAPVALARQPGKTISRGERSRIGIPGGVLVARCDCWNHVNAKFPSQCSRKLDVKVPHLERVFLNEIAAVFDDVELSAADLPLGTSITMSVGASMPMLLVGFLRDSTSRLVQKKGTESHWPTCILL